MVILFNFLRKYHVVFHRSYTIFILSPAMLTGFQFLYILIKTCYFLGFVCMCVHTCVCVCVCVCVFDNSYLNECEAVSPCDFDLYFPNN